VTATVTAVDDAVADGDVTCVARTGTTTSLDPNYQGHNPADVTVTVEDDDQAGVTVEPTSLNISEPSGSDTFIIRLGSQPTAQVTVPLSAANGQCSVLPASAVLNSTNWTAGVTATVTAVDDDVADGPQMCLVQTGATASADTNYQALDPADVTVTVADDDEAIRRIYLPVMIRRWPPIPDVPVLNPISNPGGLGSYTVTWEAAAQAETYVLEEAKSSTFAGSLQVYAGPLTSRPLSGRGAARYYYRVKAVNNWGESAWSNVRQVDVLWEAEPNDDALTQANGPIVSGLTYYGTFASATALKDYFTFDLSASHSVDLVLSNIPSGRNYDIILRNASLAQVGYSALPGNSAEHILTGALPPGRYYVQVYRFSGDGSEQPYHLRVIYE
jgi:hypothetical protein